MASNNAALSGVVVFLVLNGIGAAIGLPSYLMIVSGVIGLLVMRAADRKGKTDPKR